MFDVCMHKNCGALLCNLVLRHASKCNNEPKRVVWIHANFETISDTFVGLTLPDVHIDLHSQHLTQATSIPRSKPTCRVCLSKLVQQWSLQRLVQLWPASCLQQCLQSWLLAQRAAATAVSSGTKFATNRSPPSAVVLTKPRLTDNLDNSIQANVCTTSFNCPFITDFSTQGQPGSSCAQCGGGGFDDPFIPDDGEAEPRRGGLGAGGFGSTMCCLYHKNDNPGKGEVSLCTAHTHTFSTHQAANQTLPTESISKSNYNTTTTDQANCPPPLYGW